nr:pyridoxal-phosphate dependent enzyme [Tolypothrix sp. FACHB-123]
MQIIAVEPANSEVLSGQLAGKHNLQSIGAGFIPDVLRVDLIDKIVTVSETQVYETGRQLAQIEGILSGISTGAMVYAGLQIGQRSHLLLMPEKLIISRQWRQDFSNISLNQSNLNF